MLLVFCSLFQVFIDFGGAFSMPLCSDLLPGQYVCDEPMIDPISQQPVNCSKDTGLAKSIYFATTISRS